MRIELKYGDLREDGCRFRGYNKGKEMWLSPKAWAKNRTDARFYYIKKKYGIDRTEYDILLAAQNHSCAICGENLGVDTKNIHVDHCHNTGKNRGLLCHPCNIMIGMARDKIEVLHNAVRYLQESCQPE